MKSKIFLLLFLFNLLINKTITYDKKREILFYALGEKVFIYNAQDKESLKILSEEIIAKDKVNSLYYLKDKLYLATKKGIEIWDVKNPFHYSPFLINSFDLKECCNDIKVINSYIYLATKRGFEIYNIENLNNPYQIGRLSGFASCRNFFIYKNYCYIVDKEEGLKIIDIKDIYNPREVGYLKDIKPILDVDGENNLIYLACGKRGLGIVDVKIKSYPEKIIDYSVAGYSLALFYKKPYIYLATDIGLSIIDVKDPYSPQEINYYQSENNIKDVFVIYPYAYLDSDRGLEIVKIGKKGNIFLYFSGYFYFLLLILIVAYIIYRISRLYKDWKERIKG